jgi:hypothetical protein
MSIEAGMKYQIGQKFKTNFNSSDSLTILNNNGVTVQFTLDDGKGRGSMPLEHLNYLLKRDNLTKITNKRALIHDSNNEEKIS